MPKRARCTFPDAHGRKRAPEILQDRIVEFHHHAYWVASLRAGLAILRGDLIVVHASVLSVREACQLRRHFALKLRHFFQRRLHLRVLLVRACVWVASSVCIELICCPRSWLLCDIP